MKHVIYLAAGVLLTVAFVVLNATGGTIYEAMYYSQGFNDQLYKLGMYGAIALIVALVPWAVAALYYYVINSVRFDRWWHWLALLAVVTVVTPVLCHAYVSSAFAHAGVDYATQAAAFEWTNILIAPLMFVVASFSMRWWSSNCRHTPIPQ